MTTMQMIGILLILFSFGWKIYDLERGVAKLEKDLKNLEARVAQGW